MKLQCCKWWNYHQFHMAPPNSKRKGTLFVKVKDIFITC